jgi:hypothetical protein
MEQVDRDRQTNVVLQAMKRFITQLDEVTLSRLQACASATSTSVAQVIRLCIERRLPVIEAAIKEQQERPCESAKFAK